MGRAEGRDSRPRRPFPWEPALFPNSQQDGEHHWDELSFQGSHPTKGQLSLDGFREGLPYPNGHQTPSGQVPFPLGLNTVTSQGQGLC